MIDVEQCAGTVAELHALDPFADGARGARLWWCVPTDDAIVLGSRQGDDTVDRDACARAGLSVVRRRSGGGAVIIRHRSVLWVDIVLPTGAAPDDVRGSMVTIGEWWREVVAPLTDDEPVVHRGGMVATPWSDLVCFAGVGPGEVLVGGDKLVGLSQRRTRHGIRVQSLLYTAPAGHEYRSLLRGALPPSDPGGQAWLSDLDRESVVVALAERITLM